MPDQDDLVLPLRGGCMCGEVEYAVRSPFVYALNCHCARCRRTTGSAFKPMAGVELENFEVTRGTDRLKRFGRADHHDVRCADCGSLLYSVVREGRWVHVPLGTLAVDPGIRPTEHIFVGSKAPWYDILDDLPQHQGFA